MAAKKKQGEALSQPPPPRTSGRCRRPSSTAEAVGTASVTANTGEQGAMLPLVLAQQGTARKARMFDIAEHHLEAFDDARLRLNGVWARRSGDLIALFSLYTDSRDTLVKDGNKYRAGDAADAGRIAGEIQLALASVHRAAARATGKKWAVAFDTLRAGHQENIDAGRWLDPPPRRRHREVAIALQLAAPALEEGEARHAVARAARLKADVSHCPARAA